MAEQGLGRAFGESSSGIRQYPWTWALASSFSLALSLAFALAIKKIEKHTHTTE